MVKAEVLRRHLQWEFHNFDYALLEARTWSNLVRDPGLGRLSTQHYQVLLGENPSNMSQLEKEGHPEHLKISRSNHNRLYGFLPTNARPGLTFIKSCFARYQQTQVVLLHQQGVLV